MRLNADGSVDPTFVVPMDCDGVASFGPLTDGKILMAGGFTIGGQAQSYLAKLKADGTLDTNFTAGANNLALALAIQPDGKILVGGLFSSLAGASRFYVGRLNNTNTSAVQSLKLENSTLTWTRGGGSPEIWHASFEYSADGISCCR